MLDKCPTIIQTNIIVKLGAPEDYAAMALRLVAKSKPNVNAAIPESSKTQEPSQEDDATTMALKDLTVDKISWRVKVRVTKKQTPKPCKSGTVRMQKIDLVDQEATEMPIMLFDDAVVAVGEAMVEGEVYYIINGRVREAAVQWRKGKELMIFADKRTKVQHAVDDNSIPKAVYFTAITEGSTLSASRTSRTTRDRTLTS
eukprot:TRINITY_DN2404_c0_g1_i5.p2 TRINITY_DN2404_c0_g1~~TRINITY_DN2404_c0_g1_i5.p2  ORF type:complete len:200 (+),score=53.30 TRINITY_DN2404_c0_g1_i5:500-1099(+)